MKRLYELSVLLLIKIAMKFNSGFTILKSHTVSLMIDNSIKFNNCISLKIVQSFINIK